MAKKTFCYLNGKLVEQARCRLQLNQRQLEARIGELRRQHPISYGDAKQLRNYILSALENAAVGTPKSRLGVPTAQLLADALQVPLTQLIHNDSSNLTLGIGDSSITNKSEQAAEQQYVYSNRDLRNLVLSTEACYVDLPYISIHAHALFADAGSNYELSYNETRRLYLYETAASVYTDGSAVVFEAHDDSMGPLILSGEEVIGFPIADSKWELLHNCVVAIVYDNTFTVKKILGNDLVAASTLTLHPHRPDLASFTLQRSMIRNIYRVNEFLRPRKINL
ncbi:helix-turn-helix transcriptional regulator [uncultured Hymenobacter sp.]|uniref:S24 family peptidase n=1 Tax=uncultured Hymenobacter sp. TaxID=170016 RepID=UPI0035CA1F28